MSPCFLHRPLGRGGSVPRVGLALQLDQGTTGKPPTPHFLCSPSKKQLSASSSSSPPSALPLPSALFLLSLPPLLVSSLDYG